MVQLEFERRGSLAQGYNSCNEFSCKFICGDCGSYYGAKVLHSTDKYHCVKEDTKTCILFHHQFVMTHNKTALKSCLSITLKRLKVKYVSINDNSLHIKNDDFEEKMTMMRKKI